jgi:prepilin-type N-terminal cleavage/methylation domain-containing protein
VGGLPTLTFCNPPHAVPPPHVECAPSARRGRGRPAARLAQCDSEFLCRESGVTLIELVVALAVVALTLAIALNGLILLARSGDRGAQVVARHDALSRGTDVLRHDIERLERAVWKRGDNAEFVFRGDATGMTFVVVEPPFPTDAGPYFVVYAIQQRRDGAALTRARTPFRASATDIQRASAEEDVPVIEGRYRLRFLYLERKEGREQWLAQWTDRYRLPDLVSLEVSGLDGRGAALPIVFRPKIEAERGCVKEEGVCTIGAGGSIASESAAPSEERSR